MDEDKKSRTCEECQYAALADFGYSNWTVEGVEFICMGSYHPDGTFDRWYGEDPRLYWARWCEGFSEGEPIRMDVEREGVTGLEPLQKMLWEGRFGDQASR